MEQGRKPTVAEALGDWREAERRAIRATAQREAAEVATAAAELAEEAAWATATAAQAAQEAAGQAYRAAEATAQAATKVLQAVQSEGEARRGLEHEAVEAEASAHEVYGAARERAEAKQATGTSETAEQG